MGPDAWSPARCVATSEVMDHTLGGLTASLEITLIDRDPVRDHVLDGLRAEFSVKKCQKVSNGAQLTDWRNLIYWGQHEN